MNTAELAVPVVRDMRAADLDAVLSVEAKAYAFPWTRGNFIDSLAAGYHIELLVDASDSLLGYYVAMSGPDEMHLLNLTVAPSQQGRGHARRLLARLVERCHAHAAQALWLEVRESNQRARELYRRQGFVEEGLRRNYYPAPQGRREDAVVMRLLLSPAA